jgi:hypothetical protein
VIQAEKVPDFFASLCLSQLHAIWSETCAYIHLMGSFSWDRDIVRLLFLLSLLLLFLVLLWQCFLGVLMRLVLFIISSVIDLNWLSRLLNEGRLNDLTPGALGTAPLT